MRNVYIQDIEVMSDTKPIFIVEKESQKVIGMLTHGAGVWSASIGHRVLQNCRSKNLVFLIDKLKSTNELKFVTDLRLNECEEYESSSELTDNGKIFLEDEIKFLEKVCDTDFFKKSKSLDRTSKTKHLHTVLGIYHTKELIVDILVEELPKKWIFDFRMKLEESIFCGTISYDLNIGLFEAWQIFVINLRDYFVIKSSNKK